MTEVSGAENRSGTARIWRAGGIAIVVAIVINLVIWGVGRAAVGDLTVTQGSDPMDVGAALVVVATIVGLLFATAALWLLSRVGPGVAIWTVIAIVVGLLSMAQPLAAAEETSTGVVLALMHLATLGVALGVLRPAAR